MLTKNKLKKYKGYRAQLEDLRAKAARVTDTVKGSSPEAPYTVRSVTVAGVDLRRKAKLDKLEGLCAALEAEVMLTPESVRRVLWYRYIEGLSWDQVGQLVGANPDACRMRRDRFLERKTRR